MLMPTTLAEIGLTFQPKPPTGGAERQRSAVRREAVRSQDRLSQPKKADGPPTISILNALPFSSILPPVLYLLATKNLEYPKAPVAHRLLLLSRYLGHRHFISTWWYVSSDPEALRSAAEQFRRFHHVSSRHDG